MSLLNIDIARHLEYPNFSIVLPDGEPTTVTIWDDGDIVFERQDMMTSMLINVEYIKEIVDASSIFVILRNMKKDL